MPLWVLAGNERNWHTGIDKRVWGLEPKWEYQWKKMQEGDPIAFYVGAPVNGVVGFGKLANKRRDLSLVWPVELETNRAIYPLRLDIQIEFVLPLEAWNSRRVELRDIGIETSTSISPVSLTKSEPLHTLVVRAATEWNRDFWDFFNLKSPQVDGYYPDSPRALPTDIPTFIDSLRQEEIEKFQPQPLRNPERVKINQIIANVSKKKWVLPNFQRYFDWNIKHVKSFLSSVFNDYYVGAFLLWEAARDPQLGTMPIKGVEHTENEKPDRIILDGQQRMTSLFYAIVAPGYPLSNSETPSYFYIDFYAYFTQKNKIEVIVDLQTKLEHGESVRRLLFPLYELDRYTDWIEHFEDYMMESRPHDKRTVTVRRVVEKRLQHIWEGFEIPFILLPETMELSRVTDIFEKINSMGKPLGVFDLLIARLSKDGIDLKKLWEETVATYPKIGEYDKRLKSSKVRYYILQAMSLSFTSTRSCKREDILDIYKNMPQNAEISFRDSWREMSLYLNGAISKVENLRDGYGVKSPKMLPFSPMLPILAALLREVDGRSNKGICYHKIDVWYWSSVFAESYSGAVDAQLTADFKELSEWFIDDEKVPKTVSSARRLLQNLSLVNYAVKSSAVYRGILSLVALSGARDFETKRVLENASGNDQDHIFPKSAYSEERHVNSILNMTWMSTETNRKLKRAQKPSEYLDQLLEEGKYLNEDELIQVLRTHLISDSGYQCLKEDDFQGFLKERQNELMKIISSRLDVVYVTKDPVQHITPPLADRLANREDGKTERKSTFKYDLRSGGHSRTVEKAIAKTVAAFLNAEGGTLFIGVGDDGEILGLEKDYSLMKKGSSDSFERELRQSLDRYLNDAVVNECLRISFSSIESREICEVLIQPSPNPIVLRDEGKEEFYVRVGNSSKPYSFKDFHEYSKRRFKQ